MQAVVQAAPSDELFFETYDLLLERFTIALFIYVSSTSLASQFKILDVLLLPQTVPIRGHAVFLARAFARCLSVSEAEVLIWVALDRFLRLLQDAERSGPPYRNFPGHREY